MTFIIKHFLTFLFQSIETSLQEELIRVVRGDFTVALKELMQHGLFEVRILFLLFVVECVTSDSNSHLCYKNQMKINFFIINMILVIHHEVFINKSFGWMYVITFFTRTWDAYMGII